MNSDAIKPSIDPVVPVDSNPSLIFSAVKRTGKIILSVCGGALQGYIGYWMARLLIKLKFLKVDGNVVIQPLPYVFAGMVSAAIIETARLTYDGAMKILGDRQKYEALTPSDDPSAFDRLRQRSWKVIGRVEKIPGKIDTMFSRLVQIRTMQEIQKQSIPDRELDALEIIRRAFVEQIGETFRLSIPHSLGIYIIQKIGYTIVGGSTYILLDTVGGFLAGTYLKVIWTYQKIQSEEIEEKRLERAENKAYCDILASMYPAEFEKLDGAEEAIEKKEVDDEEDEVEEREDLNSSGEEMLSQSCSDVVKVAADQLEQPGLLDYRYSFYQQVFQSESLEDEIPLDELPDDLAICHAEEVTSDEFSDDQILCEEKG